jgi:NAD(P)-dependent dehydrogenase (short-subunit alcohol dehydrogenase family)
MQGHGLAGRVALVTGGTDGIGKEIARGLAVRGARVIIVGSDPEKGRRAEAELRLDAGHASVEFEQADLSLMQEVNRLAAQVIARCSRLHYLVLCAGVVRGRRVLTREGIESNFAIGYLSRFLLVDRLLELLRQSGTAGEASRILVISGGRNGKIHYDDVNLTRNFGTLRAVTQFCEANDVFVVELARRLTQAGQHSVTVTTLKLGPVRTNIRRGFPLWMKILVTLLLNPFLAQRPAGVAEEAVRLLTAHEFEEVTGALFLMIKRFKRISPGPRTSDPAEGHRLWDLSARLASACSLASEINGSTPVARRAGK